MSISSFLQSVFGFRTVPTTVFLILIYAAAFVSLYVTDQLPAVPAVEKQHGYGVDLEAAYKDLHLVRRIILLESADTNLAVCPCIYKQIAARPHPYNSYENDRVRAYVLDRVSEIAQDHDFVHVLDDLNTTASWLEGRLATYFEGNNVLVKVDGYEGGADDGTSYYPAFTRCRGRTTFYMSTRREASNSGSWFCPTAIDRVAVAHAGAMSHSTQSCDTSQYT